MAMQRRPKEFWKDYRKIILWTIAICALVLWLWDITAKNVLIPAYVSTKAACDPGFFKGNESSMRYRVAGSFSVSANGTTRLRVFKDFADQRVLKHENIHAVQHSQGRLSGCQLGGTLKFIDEAEAYAFQRLPEWIYKRIYGESKNQ